MPVLKVHMKILTLAALACLAGCASNSGVIPMGQNLYTVSRQAATGFGGSGTLKAEALGEASRHCSAQGKSFEVVKEIEAQPPYIMGNYPKAEVQFRCV